MRGPCRNLQVTDLQVCSKRALSTSVLLMFLFYRPIVAPRLDGCRGPSIPSRLSRVMGKSTPAVKPLGFDIPLLTRGHRRASCVVVFAGSTILPTSS